MTKNEALMGGGIQRVSLSGQVVSRIRGLVERGELSAGDQLPPEGDLARELGVSRTIVREALKLLEGQGIVAMVTGRRAMIRAVDPGLVQDYFERVLATEQADGLQDVMELRDAVEVTVAVLAAQRRTTEQVTELERIMAEMDLHVGQHELYAQLDAQFHIHLAASSQNAVLAGIMSSLRGTLETAVILGLRYHRAAGALMDIHGLHRRIADAIIAQDASEARRLTEEHCAEARAVIIDATQSASEEEERHK